MLVAPRLALRPFCVGSLHVTIQTRELMDTLGALGAKVSWASYNGLSTRTTQREEKRKG